MLITADNGAEYYRIKASGPTEIIFAFSCKVKSSTSGLEYVVAATGGQAFTGRVKINFYDYPGSGDVFIHYVVPMGSIKNWHAVPPTDKGASAASTGCVAKTIGG